MAVALAAVAIPAAFGDSIVSPDMGDFVYYYGPNPNSPYEYTNAQWLRDMGFLEFETNWLNKHFYLPYDVTIEAAECNEKNAFYDSVTKTVTLCYEFIDHLNDMWFELDKDGLYPYEQDDFVFDIVYYVLYHEIGHAVFDIYDIPYTGLQENVADQFAALMLSYTEGGSDIMYNVGSYYKHAADSDTSPPAYWTTHALDMQRFYNISCWAYGYDPVYNHDLITYDLLPEDRAKWCKEEYNQIKDAFGFLLANHTSGFFDTTTVYHNSTIQDIGDFVYYYGPNPNSPYEYTSAQWLQDINFLENEAAWLNANFRLPYDAYIEAVECGEANAYYYPYEKKVQICYELIDDLKNRWHMWPSLYKFESDAAPLEDFVFDNLYATFHHEIGHAILDIYDIPYTGLQENVADQFEALMLIRTEGGQDMLYNVADNYWYSSQRSNQPHPYWDTHGSDMQRFYNISCWAYGHDPVYNQDLITDGWLPEDRAQWCEEEYNQIKDAFGFLLANHTSGFFN